MILFCIENNEKKCEHNDNFIEWHKDLDKTKCEHFHSIFKFIFATRTSFFIIHRSFYRLSNKENKTKNTFEIR